MAALRRSSRKEDVCGVAESIGSSFLIVAEMALVSGLRNQFPRIVEEVHRSLLSRTVRSATEARETLKVWHREGTDAKFYLNKDFGRIVLFEESTSRVLEGPHFRPPQLRFLLQGEEQRSLDIKILDRSSPLDLVGRQLGLLDVLLGVVP